MFAGLCTADFDAYASNKWKSNVFNRERLEVKQKLCTLGREIAAGLTAADGSPLSLEASAEHPAQWNHKQVEAQHIFLSRNEEARKELDRIIVRTQTMASLIEDPTPQRNHLFLAVTVAFDHAEVSLKLHPDARVDRQNLERRSADHFEHEKLVDLLRGLPQPFHFGVTGSTTAPTSSAAPESAAEWIAHLATPSPLMGPQKLLYIGSRADRNEAIAAGPAFAEQTRASLLALLPLYHYIAWTRDNDFVSMRETLQQEKQARRQRGLAKQDEVRIVRGMFAGKSGIVQDVDARGGLKVMIGKMAVKVAAEDVEKR